MLSPNLRLLIFVIIRLLIPAFYSFVLILFQNDPVQAVLKHYLF